MSLIQFQVQDNELARHILVMASAAVAAAVICLTDSAVIHLACIWGVVLAAVIACRFEIMHPYFWFSGLFTLYNTANTMLYCMGFDEAAGAGYTRENTLYALLGLSVVLLIVGPYKEKIKKYPLEKIEINTRPTELTFYILAFVTIAFAFILKRRGYSGKGEMQEASDIFYRLGVHVVRWMVVFMLILLLEYVHKSRWKLFRTYLVGGVACLLMTFFTGERDVVFRYIMIVLITLMTFNIIKKKQLLILVPLLMMVMIASVYLKYAFLGSGVNSRYVAKGAGNYIQLFLKTDFYAAGGNFQWLLNKEWTKGYYGIGLLWNEIGRFLDLPDTVNLSSWFNNIVYPGSYKHRAFTLLGTGYVMGGWWGIALIFAMVGITLKILFNRGNKNLYTMAVYIYSITIFMGAFRASLYGILDMFVKGLYVAYLAHRYLVNPTKLQA